MAQYRSIRIPAEPSSLVSRMRTPPSERMSIYPYLQQRDVGCDICDEADLRSTRIVCIACYPADGSGGESIDLCMNCHKKGVYRKRDDKTHTPFHPLLQLRRALFRTELTAVVLNAEDLLENLSDEDVKHCVVCTNELPTRPYWRCTECEGGWSSNFDRFGVLNQVLLNRRYLRVCSMQRPIRETKDMGPTAEARARAIPQPHAHNGAPSRSRGGKGGRIEHE